jgi:hypothetical protein
MIAEGGPCLFELYPGICLTTEENHGKLNQGSRVVGDYSLRRLLEYFTLSYDFFG